MRIVAVQLCGSAIKSRIRLDLGRSMLKAYLYFPSNKNFKWRLSFLLCVFNLFANLPGISIPFKFKDFPTLLAPRIISVLIPAQAKLVCVH